MTELRDETSRDRFVRSLGFAVPVAATLLAVVIALEGSIRLRWLSDDAFISFRYARNLVEGVGFVFNAGERVEGYTNPLWTLFIALGLRLGASAESWSNGWSIASYAASIALLGGVHLDLKKRLGVTAPTLPIAALLGALFVEWQVFATSGLETAPFTFLALAGIAILFAPDPSWQRRFCAGLLLGLCTLVRHDGMLFVALGGASFARYGKNAPRAIAPFALAFAVTYLPFTFWRISYYGAFFPNTYYAKSANLSWWSQGIFYVALYFARYWSLLLAPFVAGAAIWFLRKSERRVAWVENAAVAFVLCAASAALYVVYVAKVGGDFMYGRVMIPATPFFLLVLDIAFLRISELAPRVSLGAACVVCAAQAFTPSPLDGTERVDTYKGIVDERAFYAPSVTDAIDEAARVIGPRLAGLPIRMAMYGSEARFAYEARIPVAIECETGLTDATIAHTVLAQRGRVGHEKHATFEYLLDVRHANMAFTPKVVSLGIEAYIPIVYVDFRGAGSILLAWEPALVAEIRARGGKIVDFPAQIDATIKTLDGMPDADVEALYEKLKRFYFAHVDDKARATAFERRIARPHD